MKIAVLYQILVTQLIFLIAIRLNHMQLIIFNHGWPIQMTFIRLNLLGSHTSSYIIKSKELCVIVPKRKDCLAAHQESF